MIGRHLVGVVVALFSVVLPCLVHAQPTELFFSEYIEGSSNNKALEIYNGTGAPIDLAAGSYVIQMYFNGNSSAGTTITLTGTVASGDVFVLAHNLAAQAIKDQADQLSGASFYNGDDAVVLRKGGTAGTIVDVIGQIGFDPGSEWGTGLVSTADNTLRRKVTVCAGDTDGSNVFDPSVEWDGYATDTFGGLGSHACACASPVINEFVANHTGTDDHEFIEVFGAPSHDYSGLRVLQIEGDSGASAGTIDSVTTVGTTDASGLWVSTYLTNGLENGTMTLLLVEGFSGTQGTDLDTNNDGTLETTPWTAIRDAVAINDGGAGDLTYGLPALSSGFDGVALVPGGASRIPNGRDTNATADWVRNDFDLAGIPGYTGTPAVGEAYNTPGATNVAVTSALTISDSSITEGNSGTVTATFNVTVSSGTATFDIATADNSATVVDNDYATNSAIGASVTVGAPYVFSVTVNGDTTVEGDETFYVNVTNVSGATVSDGQGLGTILNDDFVLTPIHTIQGPGNASPLVGNAVTTTGIVTAVKYNGFFIQDTVVDADPLTSEGILVYTSSAPPAAVTVGNMVRVSGTVSEFIPTTSDPLQPPLTEITFPTVTLLSSGNPLPSPFSLSLNPPNVAGGYDQLERLEGMLVSVDSLTVTGPTSANLTETSYATTSTGVFHGVVTGVARPFREPGIEDPDPAPAGTIPPIPLWDTNPELLRVDSDALNAAFRLDVAAGAVVTGLRGPLDYSYRRYTILPDAQPGVLSTGMTATAVQNAGVDEITVASFNILRFFDDVKQGGEPKFDTAAYQMRLVKISLAIRNYLKLPDIIGFQEVESLTVLQAIAEKIRTDLGAADSVYQAFLIPGTDIINVGFLVKVVPVSSGGPARISGASVMQVGADERLVNPDSTTDVLNDRPPLILTCQVNFADGRTPLPLTAIVVHQRSFIDIDNPEDGANDWPTSGDRTRAKRKQQSESLAAVVQARQAGPLVLLGDFNAYEFNDGYVDVLGTVLGSPVGDNQTVVSGDGVDLVNPDLDNLFDTAPASERYSYVEEGNAQSIDHIAINAALAARITVPRVERPRIDADFPEVAYSTPGTVVRVSDHDPVVAFLTSDIDSDGIPDSSDPCNDLEPPAFAVTSCEGYQCSGTVTDCSGIASLELDPSSVNGTLQTSGLPGDATWSWTATWHNSGGLATVILVARDSSPGAVESSHQLNTGEVPIPLLGLWGVGSLVVLLALCGALALLRRGAVG